MKTLQLSCVVAVMAGVTAGRCGESRGAAPPRGAISDDEATARRETATEEPASTPLKINRTGPEPPPAVAPFDAEQARTHQEAWALHLGLPAQWSNSLGMRLNLVPAGEFLMGSSESPEKLAKTFPGTVAEWFRHEQPQHRVRVTRPFYLGVYEVTQEQYERVMGKNPSFFKGPKLPVENVSWEDAVEFCATLSALPAEKNVGRTYRPPMEAEWEYACRAGTTTRFCFGDDALGLDDYAWCDSNAKVKTHPVGEKRPNAWGLYDMHGNVWEWCADWYGEYPKGDAIDPDGPPGGPFRVCRGGCWDNDAWLCRAANRGGSRPSDRDDYLGFRIAAGLSGE